ncbi:MAG: ROK family transcriptional regulator [Bacteroidia bacterium]|nr:ROK family transcriptional regulator [Bacteroidia bacterium]
MDRNKTEKLSNAAQTRHNKSMVLNSVWKENDISRLEISRRTGLSTATVSRLVDSLIQDELLAEHQPIATLKGRPMIPVYFNGKNNYLIGIDLGTTCIRGVLTNLSFETIKEIEVVTESHKEPEYVLNKVVQVILNLANTNLVDSGRIIGVGMAVAGIINLNTGIVEYSPAFNWRNIELRNFMESHVPFPVYFDNVSRAMALGEISFGTGPKFDDLICINVGYGIGAGIVIGRKLFYGTDGMAGEFGHLPVRGDEKVDCTCGKKNCLTAYASGDAIARRARIGLQTDHSSILNQVPPEELEAKHVAEAAMEGDPLAINVFTEAMGYLGRAIAGLLNIFNPQAIVLGGGVSMSGPIFWDTLKPVIEDNVFDHRSTKYHILPASHPGQSAIYGALAMVLQEILNLNLTIRK